MKQRALWLAAIAVVVVFATGCGTVTGVTAQKGSKADRAEAAGKQAALDAGGRTKVPTANVMLLTMNAKDDSSVRLTTQLMTAGMLKLGWAPQPCDGQGDAKTLETCAIGAIDSGMVDFIISSGVEPKDMSRILKKADFKDIPVINIRTSVAHSPLLTASYVPDDRAQSTTLNRYMINKLMQVPRRERKIVVLTSSTGGGSARVEQLKSDIQGTGIQIVDEAQSDLAMAATDRETVRKMLEQHPNVKAVWLANETSVEQAGKAVDKAFKDLEFPDRPLVLGFNADPQAAEALRDDEADAVVDVAYDATLWIALDRAAELLGRKEPLPTEAQPKYPLNFLDIALVTKDTAPAKGEFRGPKEDFVTFFTAKWRKEFGPAPTPG